MSEIIILSDFTRASIINRLEEFFKKNQLVVFARSRNDRTYSINVYRNLFIIDYSKDSKKVDNSYIEIVNNSSGLCDRLCTGDGFEFFDNEIRIYIKDDPRLKNIGFSVLRIQILDANDNTIGTLEINHIINCLDNYENKCEEELENFDPDTLNYYIHSFRNEIISEIMSCIEFELEDKANTYYKVNRYIPIQIHIKDAEIRGVSINEKIDINIDWKYIMKTNKLAIDLTWNDYKYMDISEAAYNIGYEYIIRTLG